MANAQRRSRSVSTRGNRPASSASTASAQSLEHFQQLSAQQSQHAASHPQPHHYHQQQFPAQYPPLQPALLQAAQHVSQQENVPQDHPIHQLIGFDPNNGSINPSPVSASTSYGNGLHGLPLQSLDPNTQQPQQQTQHYTASATPSAASAETEEKKKKGGGAGNATNDKELREMLKRNDGRRLNDVAAEVIATDRTSRAEKSKQLFAMLWLKGTCRKSSSSVPRNRVYTKYAERCSTERVIPLNPASFGKLVRVIFPSIMTRRLGVRGESKYHYVELELINDVGDVEFVDDASRPGTGSASRQSLNRQTSTGPKIDFNSLPRLAADTAAFPPQNQSFEADSGYYAANSSRGRLFADITNPQFTPANSRTAPAYEYDLRFPSKELLNAQDSLDIVLPDIGPHTPQKTDPDSVEALVALYRTHVTSLVDSVRYCKEKQFFRLYGSFHGTLTQPVQRLFAMPEVAPWIQKCDYMMYQKMIRNVSQLTLQVAPAPVLKFLDNITKLLRPHIEKCFQQQPTHVLEAKLEPAVVFTHLLRQMVRVNSTAHAAAVMLTVDDNRDRMWADYQAYVNVKRVIENELPQSCAHEEVFNILSSEIRGMFLPLKAETWLPDGTFYQVPTPDPYVDPMQETVIDRIAAFLTRLPSRFPGASARTILHTLNAVSSGVVREITVENGPSFQGWWLTKVFIDEMAQWLASLGGFLSYNPATGRLTDSPRLMGDPMNNGLGNVGSGSNNDSRFSSIGTEMGPDQSFLGNGDVSMQEGDSAAQDISSRRYPRDSMSFDLGLDFNNSQHEPTQDDSGIFLEDGLDAKFAAEIRTQLPAS
ncbi:hypothetical protein K458DRAFT_346573, partial [Lentithecium fluviatile CBS 122367]